MASLPSYQEAVSVDWLRLVAPYISPRDYAALCRVNRRFWDMFAPRLWRDVAQSGRDEADLLLTVLGLGWLLNSVFGQLGRMRPETKSLVSVFDVRMAGGLYSFNMGRNPNNSLREAVKTLPNLSCFLIDGRQDLNPAEFMHTERHVLLLSMADCPIPLPTKFVSYECLRGLAYLDISGTPGSVRPFLQRDLLPELRVLKVRHKEVDDAALEALTTQFETRLWSLDLGNNKLTDHALEFLGSRCLYPTDLRSDAHFDVEGKLEFGRVTPDYGSWIRVVESPWSGSFDHPERHLVDAPSYDPHDALPQEDQLKRLDGRGPVQPDSADGVCRGLLGEDPYSASVSFQSSRGLTHLNLTDNQISSLGIRKLLTLGRGHLQQFSCDSMPLVPPSKASARAWSRTAKLYGYLYVHTLRPVLSSNLRAVRLHHSVVTQIPTLEIDGLSTMARLYTAETSILPRSEKAFPQALVPDTNPRLTSLTLTRIPRRSCGPLISKLVNFLKLLSIQERIISDTQSRRGPCTLVGLRHLRLEFEPDPFEEGFSMAEDLDAEELLNSGDKGFSFFDDDVQPQLPRPSSMISQTLNSSLPSQPSQPEDESVRHEPEYLSADVSLDEQLTKVQVWIGPKLKRFRLAGRAKYRELQREFGSRRVPPGSPHGFWLGRLEVSTFESMPQSRPSQYWR
ncbi:uncharacterized protein NECHADRAFT_30392 [Fusarium vanettenii 77-13-4]|uniref:Uncharacterized protein n=1 Tax=Fusarium vanettenii (strain ATCC MYA-4622 / CBS 123669 / FGSC 9596 / NRRL 45880 / 77-13-4) TaxID=660122 RepID=C7YW52_FUSV7|nr:uncharacterized protein NECHADRAFT_30392 [Fusarium vanettenii 77-13-4]EEU44112.1 hypothetical protein NECHADRAFT_30392 [Fusarium vanettenii 77-13-4]